VEQLKILTLMQGWILTGGQDITSVKKMSNEDLSFGTLIDPPSLVTILIQVVTVSDSQILTPE